MRSAGFIVIIIAIVIFIMSIIIGIDDHDPIHLMYLNWTMAFSQLLVFAGIGFILYDVAREGDDKLSHLRERWKGDSGGKEIEIEYIMECPHCHQKFKYSKAMIGTVGECPLCFEEIELKEQPPPT